MFLAVSIRDGTGACSPFFPKSSLWAIPPFGYTPALALISRVAIELSRRKESLVKQRDWLRRVPWTIPVCALPLMLLGLSGISRGDELSGSGDYFSRQIVWIALAFPAMLLVTLVPYRVCRYHCYLWFAGTLACLVAVYFFPEKGGARRWIPLGLM